MVVPERTVRTAASQWRDVAAYESIVRRMLEAVSDPVTVAPDGQPLGDDALVPIRETNALVEGYAAKCAAYDQQVRLYEAAMNWFSAEAWDRFEASDEFRDAHDEPREARR